MGSLKSLSLSVIAAAILCAPALAADTVDQTIGPFGTVNNYDNAYTIPANKAQDALNVDVTPGGKSVKKRAGFAQAFALTVTTSPVHGVHFFYDSNGNDVALFFNDCHMTSSVNGGSTAVLFSTGTNGATYQCVDSQGFAYCEDSNRDPLIKTDGSSYSQITTTNNGTMVAVTPDRLVLAGFSSAPNRLDFSKSGDFTTWTVGGQPTDPNQITITAPGSKITHITYAFDRLIWFKDTSFGYVLFGPTLADWVVRTVSPNIGTRDNSSVYREGVLYFRGSDGHIYSFDGATVVKMTREIQTTISASQTRLSNFWTQTTQADWAGGTYDSTTYVDTETSSGNLQTTYPDTFDSFRQGSGTKNVWGSVTCDSGLTSSIGVSGGVLQLYASATTSGACRFGSNSLSHDISAGGTFYFNVSTFTAINANISYFFVLSTATSLGSVLTFGNNVILDFGCTSGGSLHFTQFQGRKNGVQNFDYVPQSENTLPASIKLILTSSKWEVWINGVFTSSGTHTMTLSPYYFYWEINPTINTNGVIGAQIDNFTVIPETFSYTSPVHNAPSLTAWDDFGVTNSAGGGTQTFYIRASTNSFSAGSSTPSWTSITSGQVPSISTGTFFQIRDDFVQTSTGAASQLNDFTQNWFEGNASDKAYAVYHRDAIWFAVASGTGASSNNRILRYDMLNQGWLLYDIPMDGMYVRNQSLYFGSATGGYIYKFGDVNNDAGAAINAYWKSKDFFVDSPFTDKELGYISTIASSQANSTMTVTYTLSGQTSTSYSFPTYKANSSFAVSNKNIPTGKSGRTVNIQFGNNAADQPFEVFGIQFGVRPKPWNAVNQ